MKNMHTTPITKSHNLEHATSNTPIIEVNIVIIFCILIVTYRVSGIFWMVWMSCGMKSLDTFFRPHHFCMTKENFVLMLSIKINRKANLDLGHADCDGSSCGEGLHDRKRYEITECPWWRRHQKHSSLILISLQLSPLTEPNDIHNELNYPSEKPQDDSIGRVAINWILAVRGSQDGHNGRWA